MAAALASGYASAGGPSNFGERRRAGRAVEEGEAVKKRPDQSEEARQWSMTFYLIIAAAALATFLAMALARRYL
jgi:hypothetical protein